MLDTADCFELSFELFQALRIVRENALDGHRLAVLQDTLVHCAGRAVSDDVLLTQILCHPHDVIVEVEGHIHVQDNQLW